MLRQVDYIACINEQLASPEFGDGVKNKVIGRYKAIRQTLINTGLSNEQAASQAATILLNSLSLERAERTKRLFKQLAVVLDTRDRIGLAKDITTSKLVFDVGGSGEGYARAAISMIESDPRIPNNNSYVTVKEAVRGQLMAPLEDVLEHVGKGMFGRQKGKMHFRQAVDEIFGIASGNPIAKAMAGGFKRAQELGVDLFNLEGGSLVKRADYGLPQAISGYKAGKKGLQAYKDLYNKVLDWSRMRWPDGSHIDPADYDDILEYSYNTAVTDGANRIDPNAMHGYATALGNQIDKHRFFILKGPAEWWELHQELGEGNVYEVMVGHLETMAHKIALLRVFGPNPELAKRNIRNQVLHEASKDPDKTAVKSAEAALNKRFEPMFDVMTRSNPMDPDSVFGATIAGSTHILISALLGSSAFLAVSGDFMQRAVTSLLSRTPAVSGLDTYFKALALEPTFQAKIAAQTGFIMDQSVAMNYTTQRFFNYTALGPKWTRVVADANMRLSVLAGHTRAARWTVQHETMGLLARELQTEYQDSLFNKIFQRYGITKEEWDVFRANVRPWSPEPGTEFARPLDILKSGIPNAQNLYIKFQGMILSEAKNAVPDSTMEAAVALKGTSRPDTVMGAILQSFAMFKNFPLSFQMIYGRLGLSEKNLKTRVGYYAALGAGTLFVGALGTQMREVSKGRDPLDMTTPEFWAKALLSGGGLAIWGDFLFSGINDYNMGPVNVMAGPLGAFAGDTLELVLGDAFKFASALGTLSEEPNYTTSQRAVQWAKRYTPGTSLWYARLILERHIWDVLQEMADPLAYKKWQRADRKRMTTKNQASWWLQGDDEPYRLPDFGAVLGQ